MQALIDFFSYLGSTIFNLINFLLNFIRDLFYIIELLGNLVISIPAMIGWLPSACISLVITSFSIVVIYKVMGREG